MAFYFLIKLNDVISAIIRCLVNVLIPVIASYAMAIAFAWDGGCVRIIRCVRGLLRNKMCWLKVTRML